MCCYAAVYDTVYDTVRGINFLNRYSKTHNLVQMRERLKFLVIDYPPMIGCEVSGTEAEVEAACYDVGADICCVMTCLSHHCGSI